MYVDGQDVMDNSYKYFHNKDCEFYPCHDKSTMNEFNCLFCFCPLYKDKDCGGKYRLTDRGIKDCSECLVPHSINGYDYIINKLINKD